MNFIVPEDVQLSIFFLRQALKKKERKNRKRKTQFALRVATGKCMTLCPQTSQITHFQRRNSRHKRESNYIREHRPLKRFLLTAFATFLVSININTKFHPLSFPSRVNARKTVVKSTSIFLSSRVRCRQTGGYVKSLSAFR